MIERAYRHKKNVEKLIRFSYSLNPNLMYNRLYEISSEVLCGLDRSDFRAILDELAKEGIIRPVTRNMMEIGDKYYD